MDFLTNPVYVLTMIFLLIIVAEWLVQKTILKSMSTALLIIILGAIAANLKLIPSASNAIPLYEGIFNYLAPLSIFYLLLEVNLGQLRKAGAPMLVTFLLGSLGTFLGVLVGLHLLPMKEVIGEDLYPAIGGMFTGTYIGGSINFNAIALEYDVFREGVLYAGAVAVDNIMTAIWMLVTLAIPKLLSGTVAKPVKEDEFKMDETERESISIMDIALLSFLGLFSIAASSGINQSLADAGMNVPSILIVTTFALVFAQFPAISRIRGARTFGLISVYIFLAVIGAFCEIEALAKIGSIGATLMGFVSIVVLVHGILIFGAGRFFYKDNALLSIASQANIGGSTTAMALAKSFNRPELMLPAILVGALGTGLGTYLGFLVAEWVG